MRTAFAISTSLLLSFSSTAAYSWGREGHQIIALIAAKQLTPAAKAQVTDLLGGSDAASALEQYSTWADEIRSQRPETRAWHYVNIETGSTGYSAARDCPNGDCVIGQIERDISIIRNQSLAKPIRAEALRFLIHFVGDETQPLHCSDNHDRGANEVRVILNGDSTNFHAVWDRQVVEALGDEPATIAAHLSAKIIQAERSVWSKGTPASWANECWSVAKRDVYASLSGREGTYAPIVLPSDYAHRKAGIAAEQLERAGVRLASVLNAAFTRTVALPEHSRSAALNTIHPEEAASHVGQTVTVEGTVTEIHTARSGSTTFIDMGGEYPNNTFTGVIFKSDMAAVGDVSGLAGKTVDITGTVRNYRGQPEIVITSRYQIAERS